MKKEKEYFENVQNRHQKEFMELQDHCTLCGALLEVKHQKDPYLGILKEEAYCPHCEVRTRNTQNILH